MVVRTSRGTPDPGRKKNYDAKVGDSVFGLRKVPHSFAKIGAGDGKLLLLFQPAGQMEEFFKRSASELLKI